MDSITLSLQIRELKSNGKKISALKLLREKLNPLTLAEAKIIFNLEQYKAGIIIRLIQKSRNNQK